MKSILLYACLALLSFSLTGAASVVDITPTTIDSILNGSKSVLVKFFAPWCGHCKALAPTWDKLGDAFDEETDIVIGKVDCDKYDEVCKKYDIQGFPTIKFFPVGSTKPQDYNSGRDLESLTSYVNKAAGTYRATDGTLLEDGGRDMPFEEAIKEVLGKCSDVTSCLDGIKTEAGKVDSENKFRKKIVDFYVKAISKRLAKSDWVKNERQRLETIIKKDPTNLAKDQKTYIYARVSILKEVEKTIIPLFKNYVDEL